MPQGNRRQDLYLAIIFFVSGCPALLYQLVWQRSLFTIYGINIESVTVVVTAFMLGLGLGSLAGGKLSENRRVPLLLVFAGVEYGIGAYGLVSLDLFQWAGAYTAGGSTLQTGFVTFLLVLVPTLFMGATLPLLVAHLVRGTGNVGRSVGLLYFVNTIGSAAACFVAAFWSMRALGISGTIGLAAAMNAIVGTSALVLGLWARRQAAAPDSADDAQGAEEAPGHEADPEVRRRFIVASALVFVAGYISLSYEILWVRVYSFTSGGMAAAFALLLGAYLLGIALGSLLSRRFCKERGVDGDRRHLLWLAAFVAAANLTGYLVVPSVATLVGQMTFWWTLFVVVIAAAGLGATFPLICHFGIPADHRAGARLSYLYLFNILGSSFGSLTTGFILLDLWTLKQILVGLALFGLVVAAAIAALAKPEGRQRTALAVATVVSAGFVLIAADPLFHHLWEKLQRKEHYVADEPFASIFESKGGVVTIKEDGRIYGNGIYDGRVTTDVVKEDKGIARAYSLSALHPAPKKVLEIGLSMGAWAQVLAHHPQLDKLTIVEIDEGYLGLIPKYPVVSSLLENPKVDIIIDDGRRWLVANPDEKFDFIVLNMTFHWRAHASSLLSVEFLEIVREHLNEGGIIMYNTTSSGRVYSTGLSVFPHGAKVWNNLALSDRPLRPDKERWRKVLAEYRIDGEPVFDLSRPGHRKKLSKIVRRLDGLKSNKRRGYFRNDRVLRRRFGKKRLVTDDNMGTEWDLKVALKSGRHFSR